MTEFDDKVRRKKSVIQEEFEHYEKHGRTSCATCDRPYADSVKFTPLKISIPAPEVSQEEPKDKIKLKVLDSKVEELWKFGEPIERPQAPMKGKIPVISDIELNIANEAIEAIAEKYGIKKHDLSMFRRAHIMRIYFELCQGTTVRFQSPYEIFEEIIWH